MRRRTEGIKQPDLGDIRQPQRLFSQPRLCVAAHKRIGDVRVLLAKQFCDGLLRKALELFHHLKTTQSNDKFNTF